MAINTTTAVFNSQIHSKTTPATDAVASKKTAARKINTRMSPHEMAKTQFEADRLNKKLGVKTAEENTTLGKDSFLKLLVTELQHQDPTKPMEDKQFIAQMAQFSSLEQMKNLNNEVRTLIKSSRSSEAYGLLGKNVESYNPLTQQKISGQVSSIEYNNDQVSLKVNNQYIDIANVQAVHHVDTKK
ncbi:MAG: flagellar hook assembly protein FlgD [bacterium]|nr:flagellar hook assembly protein FlgD [bacterium]